MSPETCPTASPPPSDVLNNILKYMLESQRNILYSNARAVECYLGGSEPKCLHQAIRVYSLGMNPLLVLFVTLIQLHHRYGNIESNQTTAFIPKLTTTVLT